MHLTNSHSPQVSHYLRRGIHQTLDELSKSAQQQPLRKIDRLATERCLHILIDAAIGVGKECCYKAGNSHSGDAYSTLLRTHDLLERKIPHTTIKSALGMRNAIIHDYLNLNWARIETALVTKQYEIISQFIEEGLTYLES